MNWYFLFLKLYQISYLLSILCIKSSISRFAWLRVTRIQCIIVEFHCLILWRFLDQSLLLHNINMLFIRFQFFCWIVKCITSHLISCKYWAWTIPFIVLGCLRPKVIPTSRGTLIRHWLSKRCSGRTTKTATTIGSTGFFWIHINFIFIFQF